MTGYDTIPPITDRIPAERQAAKRHYGVHPYFTRRPYNVVREYIRRYSKEGDRVLDPFGGSGVTAIEAFLENRIGIQNDLNPLANFIASGIVELAQGKLAEYRRALEIVELGCSGTLKDITSAEEQTVATILQNVNLPPNADLPANSDATHLYDLFEPKHLAAIGILKSEIDRLHNKYARNAMRLALSATIAKLNRTFLSAEGRAASRGGSSIFSIYRYKLAKKPVFLPPWETFRERALNILAAKSEIDRIIEARRRVRMWSGEFELMNTDVLDLPKKLKHRVDYIFTDPPYGGHIAYLDLSTMWNAWLGTMPDRNAIQREIIVGGDANHSGEQYIQRLGESIATCVKLLKPQRWMSVVFQHWNIAYFHSILAAAAEHGAELRAAVSQVGDPIWSMHKKKGSDSVLAGELVLTFLNTGNPVDYRIGQRFDLEGAVRALLRESGGPIYGEHLFNTIVLQAWHAGAIDSLDISKAEFSALLSDVGWQYDEKRHFWTRLGSTNRRPDLLRASDAAE